jgi:hypothetical protein
VAFGGGVDGIENLTTPGFDPLTVQPAASCYTDCLTPEKSQAKYILIMIRQSSHVLERYSAHLADMLRISLLQMQAFLLQSEL